MKLLTEGICNWLFIKIGFAGNGSTLKLACLGQTFLLEKYSGSR